MTIEDDTRQLADLLANTEGGGYTAHARRLIDAGVVPPTRHAALVAAAREVSEHVEAHFDERPATLMWWVDSRRIATLRAALDAEPPEP